MQLWSRVHLDDLLANPRIDRNDFYYKVHQPICSDLDVNVRSNVCEAMFVLEKACSVMLSWFRSHVKFCISSSIFIANVENHFFYILI